MQLSNILFVFTFICAKIIILYSAELKAAHGDDSMKYEKMVAKWKFQSFEKTLTLNFTWSIRFI